MACIIRLATPQDAEQIQSIYAPVVSQTAISFENEPPSIDEMRARIAAGGHQYPWLACENSGALLGYAYATSHRTRAAYQWCVETSVYVDPLCRRCGVARGLYAALLRILALQGFYNAYAGITLPNPASVALHEACGFEMIGIYRSIGSKLGAWHDVGWWGRALQDRPAAPSPPVSIQDLGDRAELSAALTAGCAVVRR
jgi:phosphinothricin acetyltransferase